MDYGLLGRCIRLIARRCGVNVQAVYSLHPPRQYLQGASRQRAVLMHVSSEWALQAFVRESNEFSSQA